MKHLLILINMLIFTGCSSIAQHYNNMDHCQKENKPDYCGASQVKYNIYNNQGQKVYTVR